MRVLTTVLESASNDLDGYLTFHRRAGVDLVLVGTGDAATREALAPYEREGYVQCLSGASPADLTRAAVDRGAEWVLPGSPHEVWWPRGESLGDVLAAVPPRYAVVQALVRTFVGPIAEDERSALSTRTVRTSLLGPDGARGAKPEELLRPVYRASALRSLDRSGAVSDASGIPLRGWYPIELFSYPASAEVALPEARVQALLAEGALIVDTRLRDVLRQRDGAASFAVPTVVDDASYAVECAAVGEVDLDRLDRQLRALELRIAELEGRFWPRATRALRRLARRPS